MSTIRNRGARVSGELVCAPDGGRNRGVHGGHGGGDLRALPRGQPADGDERSSFDHNNGGSTGGGIFNQTGRNFTLSSSFVTNNNGSSGGGIYNDLGSTLTVKGSHVNNNNQQSGGQGGGIFNAATATVNSTEVLGNTANQGGGVYNGAGSNMNLKSDSVVQNIATGGAGSGGGVRNLGALSFPGTSVAGNTPDNCVGG